MTRRKFHGSRFVKILVVGAIADRFCLASGRHSDRLGGFCVPQNEGIVHPIRIGNEV